MWIALSIAAVGIAVIYLYGKARQRQGQAEVAAKANEQVSRTAELARRVEDEIAKSTDAELDSLGLRHRKSK